MDKKTEFVSQITDFPPLSPEATESGVSILFSKLFKFNRSPVGESTESVAPISPEDSPKDGNSVESVGSPDSRDSRAVTDIPETSAGCEELVEGRSLQNVLKRISSLVALKSSSGTRYEDTEQARYWMSDYKSRECYECGTRFSAFRRRHHCRVCGQIFCARCCSHRVPGHVCGCAGGLRVCTYCCRAVLGYLQSMDSGQPLSADLKAIQENLKEKVPKEIEKPQQGREQQGFLLGGPGASGEGRRVVEVEPEIARLEALHDTFRRLCQLLPLQQHRYRLVRYPGVWRGGDILQWLIEHENVSTRVQASSLCVSMINEGLIESATEHPTFIDYALYRPVNSAMAGPGEFGPGEKSMTESTSSFCLNLNLAESSVHLVRGQSKDTPNDAVNGESGNQIPLQSEAGNEGSVRCKAVEAAGAEHLRLLMVQGLARAGLSMAWASVLLPLCQQAANMVTLDINVSEWDIRRCVRVKRVIGGSPQESRTIGGVVFTKNVAHRMMAARLTAPKLLLLRCSIVYQRVEGKLVSLEPVILQEQEYLRHCCARVLALRPDVVLVQGAVSRLAQDELRRCGITLVLNVRASVLQRVARCTSADIVTSVDAHITRPKLGTCKAFYLLNYDSKTLMVFEGYGSDLKGCSIILRGASLEELGRVKRVTSLILLAAYNWRLESCLLADMGATLPVSSASLMFTDNSEENSPDQAEETLKVEDAFNGAEQKNKDGSQNVMCSDAVVDSDSKSKEDDNPKDQKLSVAITDPLRSDTFLKSSEVGLGLGGAARGPALSCGITVNDFSDPLRRSSQLSMEDEVFLPYSEHVGDSNSDDTLRKRWSCDEAVLSMSPHVRICAPYLESEAGRCCALRPFYCAPLFPHPAPPPPACLTTQRHRKHSLKPLPEDLCLKEAHALAKVALVGTVEDETVRELLASYRAIGGQLQHGNLSMKMCQRRVDKMTSEKESSKDVKLKTKEPVDPLDPEQHQRMHLLYYSYSQRSNNAPDFCINPMIVRMEMYGANDIPLGLFLERHCFLQQYSCSSTTCQVPLVQHVRKFIHGDGCVTVTCNTVESSATRVAPQRLPLDDEGKQSVVWWCRCWLCDESSSGGGGGGACLRAPSLALSLAKYLELRLHAPRYQRSHTSQGACPHSLHQHHTHYFGCGNTTASFRYTKIKFWEICLPPPTIATHYNTRSIREGLINQVNDLVLKGHEIFSNAGEVDTEKEQSAFKQHMDQIQLNLTSSILQGQTCNAGVIQWLWGISDGIVVGEKMLQDSLEKWTTQATAKTNFKIPQEIVDGKIESEDGGQPDFNAVDCVADSRGFITNSTEVDHQGEDEEDKNDKRGLRAILSQLLSNSQPSQQAGVVLCGGVLPVVVLAGEVSSIVAAALASQHYHQQLHNLQAKGAGGDLEDKEPGACNGSREKLESEAKTKHQKCNEHVEVQLQDGLFCRVYHAAQFLKLRAMLLCPLQSNPHIANDFVFKSADPNDAEGFVKDDLSKLPTDARKLKDGDSDSVSSIPGSDKEAVSCSPSVSSKRASDDRGKRSLNQGRGLTGVPTFSDIEEAYIRSLTRCVPWAARGGKSGSTFCKTKDDRYILKEMSKLELQLFVDLAPHYFQYITSCYQNKSPTLLGRIMGVYRVDGVGGAGGGVLVMENLWHGRSQLLHRFDLKGAERNRLAEQGTPDVVLLDENLLKLRWESPLYLQSHSAGVLWAAVQRDTAFLASHHVMDYSLLVGLDEESHELVLGIIDYIRTFTWDKKLEHIVKKGLGSGSPTIVSPEQYKNRFCAAMNKYFMQSPNQWEGMDRGLLTSSINDPPNKT